MGDPLPPLGGLTVNAPPGPPPPVFPMRDLPLELTDEVLASYLARLDVGDLCEANLLQVCMLLRGTNQCNDPDDPLWKAACARFGLTERLVGGTPDAPATPTWHVTFLAMCKEVATLEPDELAFPAPPHSLPHVYMALLRGMDPFLKKDDPWYGPHYYKFLDTGRDTVIHPEVEALWNAAVERGLLCMVHYLLGRVDGIVHDVHGFNYASLREASRNGHLAVVELLLAHGANVHAGDDGALVNASGNGHLAVVQVLLAHGANVHGNNDWALMMASRNGRLAVVEVLLARGANVHAGDDGALREASGNGHLAVVEVLLAHGANVHANDDAALREASMGGYVAVVEALLAHGADVHADTDGALIAASKNGHLAVVEVLLAAGADVHARDEDGRTALDSANPWHIDVVEALARAGATE